MGAHKPNTRKGEVRVGLDRSARAMWLVWAPQWGEGWWSVGGRAAGQAGRGPARRALPGPLVGDGEGGEGGVFLNRVYDFDLSSAMEPS